MLRANLRFCEWDPTLWSSIIRCKYGCGQNIVLSINLNRSGSNFWKGLHSTWDLFCANNFCKLSNVYSENKNDKVIWKGYPNGTFSLGASSILIWLFFMHSYNNKSFYICDDWKGWLEVNLGLRAFEKKFKLEHVVWIYFEYDLVEEE